MSTASETIQPPPSPTDPEAEVVAFLRGRSTPCPLCGYDIKDVQRAVCPECGEPLVLKIGSPRTHFGWLLLTMAPGCFSGVAAVIVLAPIVLTLWQGIGGPPWPVVVADAFGFVSAASVALLYGQRQRFLAWSATRQVCWAAGAWAVHVGAFVLVLTALALVT